MVIGLQGMNTRLNNFGYHQWIVLSKVVSPGQMMGWKLFLTTLLTINLYPFLVNCRGVDYFYHHQVHRQNVLPPSDLTRISEQPVLGEPLNDDYTVDDGYEKTRLLMRSFDRKIGGNPVSLHGFGKIGDGFNIEIDPSVRNLAPLHSGIIGNSNDENIENLHAQHSGEKVPLSSFIQHNPSPSSQLKASNLHVDSSQPLTMYARASSSASAFQHDGSAESLLFAGSVIGVTCVGIFIVIATGYFVHRINVQRRAAADVEYPAYGVVGPGATLKEKESLSSVKSPSGTSKGSSGGAGSLSPSGDRRLAQSAQMYHYHHQKQQMISSDKVAEAGQHPSTSDVDSEEEENEEGDYTVYECPGLASTGEMEVKNPLFQDDLTPVSSPSVKDTKQDGSSN